MSGCLSDTSVYLLANPKKCQHTRCNLSKIVKNRSFLRCSKPVSDCIRKLSKQARHCVTNIITDPSTHEIKPNMFSSLPIMEMDNLTERTITDDVIQNLYLIFFLTSQASNFIYTAVYL